MSATLETTTNAGLLQCSQDIAKLQSMPAFTAYQAALATSTTPYLELTALRKKFVESLCSDTTTVGALAKLEDMVVQQQIRLHECTTITTEVMNNLTSTSERLVQLIQDTENIDVAVARFNHGEGQNPGKYVAAKYVAATFAETQLIPLLVEKTSTQQYIEDDTSLSPRMLAAYCSLYSNKDLRWLDTLAVAKMRRAQLMSNLHSNITSPEITKINTWTQQSKDSAVEALVLHNTSQIPTLVSAVFTSPPLLSSVVQQATTRTVYSTLVGIATNAGFSPMPPVRTLGTFRDMMMSPAFADVAAGFTAQLQALQKHETDLIIGIVATGTVSANVLLAILLCAMPAVVKMKVVLDIVLADVDSFAFNNSLSPFLHHHYAAQLHITTVVTAISADDGIALPISQDGKTASGKESAYFFQKYVPVAEDASIATVNTAVQFNNAGGVHPPSAIVYPPSSLDWLYDRDLDTSTAVSYPPPPSSGFVWSSPKKVHINVPAEHMTPFVGTRLLLLPPVSG
jgi:hypothetical protein